MKKTGVPLRGKPAKTPFTLRTVGAIAVLLSSTLVHGADLLCETDHLASSGLPPALRSEQPLFALARNIDLVPRAGVRSTALRPLAVTPDRLAAISRNAMPGAPSIGAGTELPALRVDRSLVAPGLGLGAKLESLLSEKKVEAVIGDRGAGRAFDMQRVLPREIADEFGDRLPRRPGDAPPDPGTAPWSRLSPEEIRRRSSSCTAAVVNELEAAAESVAVEFGFEADSAALHVAEFQASPSSAASSSQRQAALRYLAAYSALLDRCTRPATTSPAFSSSGLRNRLGALAKGTTSFCTALLIGPRHVLTARHCLFDSKEGGLVHPNANVADFWIVLDEPVVRAQVCAITNAGSSGSFNAGQDHMLLRIADTARKPLPPTVLTEPALRDGRTLPTEFASFSLFPGSELLGKGSPIGLVEYTGSACLVFKKNGACYYHGCGAQAGSSGAPLFLRDEIDRGNLALAGLHVGRASSTPDCPKPSFAETNVGNVLPSDLLQPFLP